MQVMICTSFPLPMHILEKDYLLAHCIIHPQQLPLLCFPSVPLFSLMCRYDFVWGRRIIITRVKTVWNLCKAKARAWRNIMERSTNKDTVLGYLQHGMPSFFFFPCKCYAAFINLYFLLFLILNYVQRWYCWRNKN